MTASTFYKRPITPSRAYQHVRITRQAGTPANHSRFSARVYRIVSRIPKGETLTYKEVARQAGRPKAYRAVGNILHRNPDLKNVPCHRVVRSDGQVGGYAFGSEKKKAILKKEGAIVIPSVARNLK